MELHINLTPEQERLVQDELASGYYQTAEQVIAEALRVLRDRQTQREETFPSAARREAVRNMIEFVEKNSVRLANVSVKELVHEGHRL